MPKITDAVVPKSEWTEQDIRALADAWNRTNFEIAASAVADNLALLAKHHCTLKEALNKANNA